MNPPRLPPAEAAVAALLPDFATSPALLLHKFDPVRDIALIVVMQEADYRRASFLDDRLLGPEMKAVWTKLPQVMARLAVQPSQGPGPHFIFHQGHTGSTLVSRLLDELGAFGLREPMALQNLAELYDCLGRLDSLYDAEGVAALTQTVLQALSRRFSADAVPVVKATSHTGRAAAEVLRAAPQARALMLSLKPEPYLAALFAGANTPVDLRGFAQERMRRILALFGEVSAPLHALSVGDLAALAWLAERASQLRCVRDPALAPRVLDLDFDDVLAAPEPALARIAAHFGLNQERVGAALAGPVMRSYSKAPENAYSPALRSDLMNRARAEHGAEIRRGLAWLDSVGARSEAAARIIGA